jgi:SHS2 domain-containing protein
MKRTPFRFLPHTTDVEFVASGATLAKAFEASALATFATMTDLSKVRPTKAIRVSIKRRSDDISLLYDFLDRLVFLFDSRQMYFSRFKVKMTPTGLSAEIKGEKISEEHPSLALVKSVTYHEMEITRRGGLVRCQVILDI